MDYRGIPNEQTASTAANTSAAAAEPAGGKFEVFLSFCGKDTRHGFADYLYNDLEEARIRTFRDNEKLHVGEEIGAELLKAIKDSKISIPIFSKNYASSKWCLRELAQMVECQESGHKIFPIFYDVQPSDVRHQTGSYEEAFRIHKKRKRSDKKSEETVEKWKKALREVGQLNGWELQKETNGHQGKLVKIVVGKVLLELKKKYMHVTDSLVGIDLHLEIVRGLLNVDSNGVWIVGIHGMGGIGKTTIAKLIYNHLFENFECCCFLADVRETSQSPKDLVNLQKQLISNILRGKTLDIANVDEGINMIKENVNRKKVLIVLDDVDKKYQFDKLVGECDWFGSGSRIIVTTRNKEVLNVLAVDKVYEALFMEPKHSLQLFSRHAFRKDSPPEDYDDLSRKITSTAAGLPLALEVIGSSLYGKRKSIWEETLIKLKKIPNEDVQKKLRISYDALDHEQRQIFLDIACHFIGERLINPFYMWEDCEFYPTNGVNELVLRSLVQIKGNDMLRMHDQLRDLGREIVRAENFNSPEERSRWWLHDDALDILKRRAGTKMIQTLCIDIQQTDSQELHSTDESDEEFRPLSNFHFTDEEFRPLPNLRFLRLDGVELTGDFKHLFSKLRWLKCRIIPENISPTNVHLKNLVVLDLSNSEITDDWEGWSQIKEAKKLKALYLRECRGLTRTPDFSTFATLERLDLSFCDNLVQIDPSIADLINLRVLDIKWSGITKLPDAIGNLEKLEEMVATNCYDLQGETPSSIGRLSSLRKLRLNYTRICSLPTSIRGLSSLQTLDLTGCIELQSLPTSICGLSSLQTLNLTGCRELQSVPELPPYLTSLHVTCKFMGIFPSLSNLMNLKQLVYSKCLNLVEIPGDIGKLSKLEALTFYKTNITSLPAEIGALSCLKELNIQCCSKLMEIQGLKKLEWLTSLDVSGCESLERFSDLSNLMQLKELDMNGCICIERLVDLSNLRMLKKLNLSRCKKLAEVRGLWCLKSLEILNISFCTSLEKLLDLSNLRMLKEIHFFGCMKLVGIEGLGVLKSMERLDMSGCTSLERLPDLSNLGMLKQLTLSGCEELVEVDGLGVLKSFEFLDMSCCTSLERLPDLSNFGMLKELRLAECEKLVEVESLGVLKSLEFLDMSYCTSLERLPELSNLGMLKELKLVGCQKLVEVESFGVLKSLEFLDMSGCTLLERLHDLSNFGMLKELMLAECQKLVEVENLGVLKSLERLNVSWCESLERLPDLSNFGMVKNLNAANCLKLVEVEGLGVLKSLETLDLSYCTSLERLPELSNLGMLNQLRLAGCKKLAEVDCLGVLKSLKRLDVSWCKSLERLPDLSNFGMLKELRLVGCQKLVEVESFGVLKSLEFLDMSSCTSLERLPDLSNFGMLKELMLAECQKLVEVESLGVLKSLERLNVSWCESLERLPDLSNFRMLKNLNAANCLKLVEVEGLRVLKSLETLDLSCCTSLERLPELSNLGMLNQLRLAGCTKLAEVDCLGVLKSLKRLDVSWCKSLERLPDLSNFGMLKELRLVGCQKLAEVEGLEVLKSLENLDVSW